MTVPITRLSILVTGLLGIGAAASIVIALTSCSSASMNPTVPPESPRPVTEETATPQEIGTAVTITIGTTVTTGQLNDSAAATDLLLRLPLTVRFRPNNDLEKVGVLDPPLSIDGAPEGADPARGDIGYYSPWNDLVLYNGDVGYYNGIVILGAFENTDAVVQQNGNFDVRIERAG